MIAVIFELAPASGRADRYFELADQMRPLLNDIDGFLSIERFESLNTPGRILSLSFWRDEAAVAGWRNLSHHRAAQAEGRATLFADYRLRIARVMRDYGMTRRDDAPSDSRGAHG